VVAAGGSPTIFAVTKSCEASALAKFHVSKILPEHFFTSHKIKHVFLPKEM